MAGLGRRCQKGERQPNSGRKKGVLSKDRQDIVDRLAALNFDPLESLVEVGRLAHLNGELSVAAKCYADVCKYVYPQLKAVEHSGELTAQVTVYASPLDERL